MFLMKMRQIKFHCTSTWESSNGFYTHLFYISHAHCELMEALEKLLQTYTKYTRGYYTFLTSFGRTLSIGKHWTHTIRNFAHKKHQNNEFSITLFCCVKYACVFGIAWVFARGFCFPHIFGKCMSSCHNWY